ARVGEQSAVTWNRLYRSPSAASLSNVGVATGPPNVDGLPKPASSTSTRRIFGASGGAFTGRVKPDLDPSSVRFAMPWNGCAGRGSTLLSHSASAATQPGICVATASAVMIRHTIDLGIRFRVRLCMPRAQRWSRKEYFRAHLLFRALDAQNFKLAVKLNPSPSNRLLTSKS